MESKDGFKKEVLLSCREVAGICGVTVRAVQDACRAGRYRTVMVKGRGGTQYRVALSSLAEDAQIKWIQNNPDKARGLPPELKARLSLAARFELLKLESRALSAGTDTIVDSRAMDRLARMVELVRRANDVPSGIAKCEWIEQVAGDANISRAQLYRYIKLYKEEGLQGLGRIAAKRRNANVRAWDEQALRFLKGVYLKGIAECGSYSVKAAYEALCAEAKRHGWRIGSEWSAYKHIKRLHPLKLSYAKGGSRALSNAFYIARNYKDLYPFEYIVGDQHRFDFWVWDPDSDTIFRPEAYFWLDLRTRLLYGLSVAERYNAYMMGLALRMGLKRFGRFNRCLTDNGKPERSNYFQTIGGELRGYGISWADISEIYRVDKGYVVEDEGGKPLKIVGSSKDWHIYSKPYNAKAKLVERFNRTITQILIDMGVPGYIKDIKDNTEQKQMAERRINRLKGKRQLLPYWEFVSRLLRAVDIYNHRKHSALGRSPFEELMDAHNKEGWVPVMLNEKEVDLILMRREVRSVNRGRVLLYGSMYWYEGSDEQDAIMNGLFRLKDGTRIEVRHNLPYEDRVYAIVGEDVLELVKVSEGSMKRPDLTSKLNNRQRAMIKALKDEFNRLTAPIKGVLQLSHRTKGAHRVKPSSKAVANVANNGAILRDDAERIVAASIEDKKRRALRESPKGFDHPFERYRWCVDARFQGIRLTDEDRQFMEHYEKAMDDDEKLWWECYRMECRLRAEGA